MKLLLVVCACVVLTGLVCGRNTHDDFSVDLSSASVYIHKIFGTKQKFENVYINENQM